MAPLKRAIKEGASEIVCILCQAEDLPARDFKRRNLLHLVSRVVEIVTTEIITNDVERVRYVNNLVRLHTPAHLDQPGMMAPALANLLRPYRDVGDPIVIRPEDPIGIEIDDFDSADIARMLTSGRFVAEQVWRARHP